MSRPILPRWQAVDANGDPLAGARLYTFDTGTNTPKPTFADAALTVPNLNPVEADSSGTFPDIFFQPGSYRVRLATAADVTVWTADPVDSLGTISPFMLTLLDDTNAADARATLGIAYATALQMEQGTGADLIVSPRRASEWIAHRGHIAGLTLSNNGADANNDIDIAEGVACSDAAPWRVMVNGATITKQLDAAWAVGTNAGGLDQGTKANSTTYYVWLIRRSDTGVVDALFSTSDTGPTMPTGYDQKALVGAVFTDGSGNIIANQFMRALAGERRYRSAPQLVTAALGLTLPHGLGGRPTSVSLIARCQTAEAGFNAGNEFFLNPHWTESGGVSRGIGLAMLDDAAINYRVSSNGPFSVINPTNGVATAVTAANWRVIVQAVRRF